MKKKVTLFEILFSSVVSLLSNIFCNLHYMYIYVYIILYCILYIVSLIAGIVCMISCGRQRLAGWAVTSLAVMTAVCWGWYAGRSQCGHVVGGQAPGHCTQQIFFTSKYFQQEGNSNNFCAAWQYISHQYANILSCFTSHDGCLGWKALGWGTKI